MKLRLPRPRVSAERRRSIYDDVEDMSVPRPAFYVLVAVSTTVAAYGLLANSTAVVIGAMLIAPLMGPIFGIALSLCVGDRRLLGRSLAAEAAGVPLAIGVAALIGVVPLRLEFGHEILARTQPTLYDILIALASGLAGAYALVDERLSPALPGVAMATAIVPPLATCGLCVAVRRWDAAFGAFLLFFANFLAIEIAAAVVFTVIGMVGTRKGVRKPGPLQFLGRFGISLLLLVLVGIFMTKTLLAVVADRRFDQAVRGTLSEELRTTAGAQLSDLRRERVGGQPRVIATILTPVQFEPRQVGRLEDALRRDVDPGIRLVLRSLISKDGDREGPVFVPPDQLAESTRQQEEATLLSRVSEALRSQLQQVAGARLVDVIQEERAGVVHITAIVETPSALGPEDVARMEQAVGDSLGRSASLVVRSLLTRDADAAGYLYTQQDDEPPLLTAARDVLARACVALWGARLVTLSLVEGDPPTLEVTVEAVDPLGPRQVALIERWLVIELGEPVRLVMHSTSSCTADAQRYLSGVEVADGPIDGILGEIHSRLTEVIEDELSRAAPGARLVELRFAEGDDRAELLGIVRTPRFIEPRVVRRIEERIHRDIEDEVALTIRSVVGGEATAAGYDEDFDTRLLRRTLPQDEEVTEDGPSAE